MDRQPRHETQEASPLRTRDGTIRVPVPGTIAVGRLRNDDHLHRAKGLDGELVDSIPPGLGPDPQRPARGQQRYAIFCAPCHDSAGTGTGIVVERGMVTPPSLLDARLRQEPLGHLYKVIAEGERNMPSHAAQIPVEDRWAIATHVRSLQGAGDAGRDRPSPGEASEEGWR
jgi:mono/diheme cytochrome c family protein